MLSGFRPVLWALDIASGWSRWPVLFSAVSGTVAAEARTLLGGRPVHVLPNGVDARHWMVERVVAPAGELRLVSVMRLNARKRGAALLGAVARAQRVLGKGVRLRLRLVGEGPQGPRLRRLAAALGVAEAVTFEGFLPREGVRAALASADAFVLASRLESFGIAALEARAAGVPVLALARGGVKEFVRHGRDGLIAQGDRELAHNMVRLGREPELLEALTRGAAERPVPFSWEEARERHLAAYRTVMLDTPVTTGRGDQGRGPIADGLFLAGRAGGRAVG
jgi:glycosyltransferase involved in cell wall biosynthesis